MDPVTRIAGAIEAVFNFLCTPEGQEIVKVWRADTQEFRAAVKEAKAWFERLSPPART